MHWVCLLTLNKAEFLKGINWLFHRHFKEHKDCTRNEKLNTGVAEIVKHLKILIMCFSAGVSLCVGVCAKASKLFDMECGELRGCVCCGTVYSDGVHYRDSLRILLWTESTGSPMSKYSLSIGKAVAWRWLYQIKVSLVGCPHFACPRT
jgi:hypothetical protein